MAICQGITYDTGNNRITVEYPGGGDVHGFNFPDSYTFQDIYDTDVDGGWGVFKKYGNVYISDASIYIEGADTYFQNKDFTLIFQGNISDIYSLNFCWNININLYRFQIIDYIGKRFRSESSNVTLLMGLFNSFSKIDALYGIFNYITFNDCYKIVSHSSLTEFSEITIIRTRLESRGVASVMENISIFHILSWQGGTIVAGWADAENMKNINMVYCDIDYHLVIRDYVTSFIDSQINIDSYTTQYYSGTFADFILKSTFKVNISGGDSGTATLYDQFGSQVAQQTLSGEWILVDPVVYAKRRLESDDGATVTSDVKTVYEPFKLVVTKSGYNTLEIPNIMVTAGEETNVFGEMVANPTPLEFTINDVLERVFSDSVNLTVTETINRWGQSKELSFTGSTTDSDSYRITYQSVTNTYLIEQYIDGAWETVATLSSGDILTFQSDIEALIRYVDRSLTGSISTQNVTGTVQAVEIEGSI